MTADQIRQNKANRKSIRFLMFDLSPEGANFWFDISNAILLFGAVLVAVGTFGTIKLAGVKEKFSDDRIAANEAETKRAVADSDFAKEGTAKANERIAELSAQAEQLRKDTAEAQQKATEADLARMKLELQLAPRNIPVSRRQSFIDAISKFKGISIRFWVFPVGTSDTSPLAQVLYDLTKQAGWHPWLSSSLSGQALPDIIVGAKAGSGSENAALALVKAIRDEGGIDAKLADPFIEEPEYGATVNENEPAKEPFTVIIRIGSKP